MFSASNNSRTLRSDEIRVWRFGESAICRSEERANELFWAAKRVDPDASITRGDEK